MQIFVFTTSSLESVSPTVFRNEILQLKLLCNFLHLPAKIKKLLDRCHVQVSLRSAPENLLHESRLQRYCSCDRDSLCGSPYKVGRSAVSRQSWPCLPTVPRILRAAIICHICKASCPLLSLTSAFIDSCCFNRSRCDHDADMPKRS